MNWQFPIHCYIWIDINLRLDLLLLSVPISGPPSLCPLEVWCGLHKSAGILLTTRFAHATETANCNLPRSSISSQTIIESLIYYSTENIKKIFFLRLWIDMPITIGLLFFFFFSLLTSGFGQMSQFFSDSRWLAISMVFALAHPKPAIIYRLGLPIDFCFSFLPKAPSTWGWTLWW